MIYLEDLQKAKTENEEKIAELNAENRVFDKLIQIEMSKTINEEKLSENFAEEYTQQDEI